MAEQTTPEPPAGSEHYREGWRHGYEQAAIDRERAADTVPLTFPFGEILADELEARRIPRRMLCRPLGLSLTEIDDLIEGKRELTGDIAARLGAHLGTSAEMWLRLDQLHRAASAPSPMTDTPTDAVAQMSPMTDIPAATAPRPMDLDTARQMVQLGAPMPDAVHREVERTLLAALDASPGSSATWQADAALDGRPGEPVTESALQRAAAVLRRAVAEHDHPHRQEIDDVGDWLAGAIGDPGSGFPVRIPVEATVPVPDTGQARESLVIHPRERDDMAAALHSAECDCGDRTGHERETGANYDRLATAAIEHVLLGTDTTPEARQ